MMRLPHDAGITLTELIVVLALAVSTAGASLPAFESGLDALRIRHAAGVVASRARLARQEAVVRSRHVGLVFDRTTSGWRMSVCGDGNGNGLRRLEIGTGVDRCAADPDLVNSLIPGVEVAVDPGLRGPDGEAGSADAIRFGASDMASFSPLGSCTGGTLFLRSRRGRQYAVRIAGATGRTRILRYDDRSSAWVDG